MDHQKEDFYTEGLTVSEVFEIFSEECGCELLAGKEGLSNLCYHCVVMETPDGVDWLTGGEVLLSSGYALKDRIGDLPDIVHEACRRGASAMVVKEGRFFPYFPQEMLQAADECQMPIIQIPRDARYTGVVAQFYNRLFLKQHNELVWSKKIDRRLLSLISDYQNADSVVVVLSRLFNVSIVVYDRAFKEISECYATNDSNYRKVMDYYRSLWKSRDGETVGPETLETEYGQFHAWAIPFHHTGVAYCMCALSTAVFDNVQQEALVHGAMIMSNKFQAEERRVLQDLRMRRVTTEMMLTSDSANEHLAHSLEKDFSWNKKHKYVCIVIQCLGQEQEDGAFRQYLLNIIERLCDGKFLITEKSGRYFIFFSAKDKTEVIAWAQNLKHYVDTFTRGKICLRLGVSNIYPSLKDLPSMYHDCLVTTTYGQKEGIVWYDQEDIARFLYSLFEDHYFKTCYENTIRALTEYGKKKTGNLLKTLSAFFDCGMNHSQTAKALYIHVETLRYRLEKIKELTGFSVDDPEGLLVLQLCVRRWDMLREGSMI